MPRFIGTVDDYEKYIGPRIRNIVNILAKNERNNRNGKCEFCGEHAELESAHKHGKERKTIIREALKKYNNGTYFDVDVEKCEKEILELHKPIEKTFYFLCRKCHRKYDNNKSENKSSVNKDITNEPINNEKLKIAVDKCDDVIVNEINKIDRRIKGWLLRREQYNSKILYAFIKIYKQNNGIVKYTQLCEEANIPDFKENFDQMKNFGEKNHGKIFEQKNEMVYLWDKVEEKIWKNYEKYGNVEKTNGV